jgi:uncharacterized membrane protein
VGILSGTINLPFGIVLSGLGLNPILVFLIAVISNIVLGILLFNFVGFFDESLRKSKIKNHYSKFMDKTHRKLKPYVYKYGILGVAFFIGIPLPGSGVYAGSLGAFMLGLNKKQFYIANIIGVLIAATIVTFLTLTGKMVFG